MAGRSLSRPRPARPRGDRLADVIAEGAPVLAVADEDVEVITDLLAELLVAGLERDEETTK